MGQKFNAKRAHANHRPTEQQQRTPDRQHAIAQRKGGGRFVQAAQPRDDPCLHLGQFIGQQHRRQHRRDREGRDQAAGNGIGIGLCHRPEDMALDARQREQRQEARDDDRGGEEDTPTHLMARPQHRGEAAGERIMAAPAFDMR
ncbi:hypothetical protein D9M73_118250 [compost metagenome]